MLRDRRTPYFLLLIMFVLGSIAFFLNQNVIADVQDLSKKEFNKFFRVVQLLKFYYVEDIEWDTAMEGAISGMLQKLDPHSVYIEPKKAEKNKENFSGHYEGIGIEFDVIDGYITVISPIAGSPSERLGLQAGDRIVKINGKSAIGIDRDEVPNKLKGPKGTSVDVTILREGLEEPLEVTIIRDVIPIYTVTTKFMVDDSTGYIWVNRFAATTSEETEAALQELKEKGMKRLILDLRGNPGGYLHEAVKMAGMFIPGHQLIVETRGRNNRVDEKFYSDQWRKGGVYDVPLIVMIDRGSASASEIVSGAIQDYDRGLILGTNSFGKGLVQKEFPLSDKSAVRVTTAKYYTPSGRLIQRDYKGKELNEYYQELGDTTWTSEDSLKNRPKFETKAGRTVYGGGGIRPDDIVKYESFSPSPKLTNKLFLKRLFFEYASQYAIEHSELETNVRQFQESFQVSDEMMEDFKKFAKEKEVEVDEEAFQKARDFISTRIKAEIARHFWERDGFYYVILHNDNQFLEAVHSFKKANQIAMLNKNK
ncbi:MAG: S41 family peptidase [Calditrichia bacterium]